MAAKSTYAQASKTLLRNSLLDALRDLLQQRDWSSVTMADVATITGVSRQTVYNEFGSRMGLATAYAMRLVGEFCDVVAAAVRDNVDDLDAALRQGFADFFRWAAADPMIRSLLDGEAKPDLLRLITTDAAPLIDSATDQLTGLLTSSWVQLSTTDAVRIGGAIARMALSYVAMPPQNDRDVAADVAAVIAPAVLAARR
ncbi:TetR/AcrR family transcriptional regulator [Williamsia sterculiae]|uniref:TetR/AcrR family transcriptional regulator n=1 Tax=Williamsia sterculiae TaxID=1344003 RepID=UPI00097057AF|nr:TetR/AcrR family transcriptional regulator [Williamsia sterculiae]